MSRPQLLPLSALWMAFLAPLAWSAPPSAPDPLTARLQAKLGATPVTECGVSCLYDKGNETLSLMAAFIVQRMNRLKAIALQKSPAGLTSELTALGSCTAGEINPVKNCWPKFKILQSGLLMEIRAAMNANAAAGDAIKGAPYQLDVGSQNQGRLKLAQVPTLLSWDELKLYYVQAMKRSPLTQIEYNDWLKQIAIKPKASQLGEDRFVQYETVSRFPGSNSTETLVRVKVGPNGAPLIDSKKIKLAEDLEIKLGTVGLTSPIALAATAVANSAADLDQAVVSSPASKIDFETIRDRLVAEVNQPATQTATQSNNKKPGDKNLNDRTQVVLSALSSGATASPSSTAAAKPAEVVPGAATPESRYYSVNISDRALEGKIIDYLK